MTTKCIRRAFPVFVVLLLLAASVPAQRRGRATRPNSRGRTKPAVTRSTAPRQQPNQKPLASAQQARAAREMEVELDALLPSGSYAVYGEVRAAGQLIRSGVLNELVEPLRQLGQMPSEFEDLLKFLNAHAEELSTSRIMFAAKRARPSVPEALMALELPSPEAAKRFMPELRTTVDTFTAPAGGAAGATSKAVATERLATPRGASSRPLQMKRFGSLIVASSAAFTLKALRGNAEQQRLFDDQHFQAARNRFAGDPVFVYFDVTLSDRIDDDRRREAMERAQTEMGSIPDLPLPPIETVTGGELSTEPSLTTEPEAIVMPGVGTEKEETPTQEEAGKTGTGAQGGTSGVGGVGPGPVGPVGPAGPPAPVSAAEGPSPDAQAAQTGAIAFSSLMDAVFGSGDKWPLAVGASAAFEGEHIVMRALLINNPEEQSTLIPFIPLAIPGPAIASEASALLPADTNIYVTLSLDPQAIYRSLRTRISERAARTRTTAAEQATGGDPFEQQVAAVETLLGFKIEEELLPSLGNEIAVGLPSEQFGGRRRPKTESESAQQGPVFLISLRDPDKVRSMVQRSLAALTLLSGSKPQTMKRGEVEITNMMGFYLAFINNYLVVSPTSDTLMRVADARTNGQTLAASNEYHQATLTQPRQSLAQVYLSSDFFKNALVLEQPTEHLSEELRNVLARFDVGSKAVTHALSGEGGNFLHELRLPKSLITRFVAQLAIEEKLQPLRLSEGRAMNALYAIAEGQSKYHRMNNKSGYASLDELVEKGLLSEDSLDHPGYRIKLTASGSKYEVTATPTDYGKTGFRSFFMDETGVIKAGDHGGQPASASDEPIGD